MGTKTQKLSNVVDQIVEWQSVFTGDGSTGLTAVAGRGYFIDTTSGTVTVTLPASPKAGDTITIADYATTFATNNVTINPNGNKIEASTDNGILSTNDQTHTLVYTDSTQGWKIVNQDTTSAIQPTFTSATGGTITESGDFKIHTFTGDGCFVVSTIGSGGLGGPSNVDYLVVAGGGGGGGRYHGAGGGAGGFRTTFPSPGCNAGAFPISATTFPITVGSGGAGGGDVEKGTSGSNSTFSTITSAGGGGGANYGVCSGNGVDGGSGGGGSTTNCASAVGGSGNTPPVSPPQGNDGGTGTNHASPNFGAGGGGGAGATGSNGTASAGGAGGNGLANSINGSSVTRAGGGGGSAYTDNPASGAGGTGGGGAGTATGTAGSGTANTGGGGGAAGDTGGTSGAGGKGIVIIRYKFQ